MSAIFKIKRRHVIYISKGTPCVADAVVVGIDLLTHRRNRRASLLNRTGSTTKISVAYAAVVLGQLPWVMPYEYPTNKEGRGEKKEARS